MDNPPTPRRLPELDPNDPLETTRDAERSAVTSAARDSTHGAGGQTLELRGFHHGMGQGAERRRPSRLPIPWAT